VPVEIPLWRDILEHAHTGSWSWKWLIILLKTKANEVTKIRARTVYKHGCTVSVINVVTN